MSENLLFDNVRITIGYEEQASATSDFHAKCRGPRLGIILFIY